MVMRLVLAAMLMLAGLGGAGAAAPPDRLSEQYLACVIGKGAVELFRGASAATALKRGESMCKSTITAIFDAYGSEGDVGALLTADHERAAHALAAIAADLAHR